MAAMKSGNGTETRITQACDRCRKKKIKCDGIRPCCLQCSNAGLECRTSDVLSRRAISRNYTKSLEETVRTLEMELRDIKNLLNQKDERIEMLSKIRSNGWPSHYSSSSTVALDISHEPSTAKEGLFRIQASPLFFQSGTSEMYFMGASSGAGFINVLKHRMQETGIAHSAFSTEDLLNPQSSLSSNLRSDSSHNAFIPPRSFSDKCVMIFLQVWAPLFPVIDVDSFLELYGEYLKNPRKMTDDYNLTQLHLVFTIAALSNKASDRGYIAMCDHQWQNSVEVVVLGNSLVTVQCLVLASLLSLLKGDYTRLQHYKGMAVGLSYRIGLHQSQKDFPFCAVTIEMRKKVFWTLYTLDRFSAAIVGLPTLLKEEDIKCEYPTNVDEVAVTKEGYLPTAPSKFTRTPCTLGLFQVSRILSRVLEQNYPTDSSHALSLQRISALDSDLRDWYSNLPKHLRFTSVQGKPASDMISGQSATLCITFHYVRSLIYLPTIGSTLGNRAAPFVDFLADSSKNIIQIMQLMEEHDMSFSICLNRNKILTICGLSLLYQHLHLKQESHFMEKNQSLISTVTELLENANALCVPGFRRLATSIISFDRLHNPSFSSTDTHVPIPQMTDSTSPPFDYRLSDQQIHQSSYSMAHGNEMILREHQQDGSPLPSFSEQLYSHSNDSCNSNYSTISESPKSCPSLSLVVPNFNSNVPNSFDFPSPSNNLLAYQPRFHVPMCTSSSPDGLMINSLHSLQESRSNTAATTPTHMHPSVVMGDIDCLIPDVGSGGSSAYDSAYNDWSNCDWGASSYNVHSYSVGAPAQGGLGFDKEFLGNGDNRAAFNFYKSTSNQRQSR